MNGKNTLQAQAGSGIVGDNKAPSILEELSLELENLERGIYDLHARLDKISNRSENTPNEVAENDVDSSLHITVLTGRVRLAGQIVHKMIDELVI